MSGKNKIIPNPNKISDKELLFIKGNASEGYEEAPSSTTEKTEKRKGHMISMPESFSTELNLYLKENPAEGTKSGFIVRVVSEYIKNKSNPYK